MPTSRPIPFSQLLGTIALAPTLIGIGMVVAMASAHAAPAGFQDENPTIVLHNTAKPADQRQLRRRIADAALSVCGGGPGSLAEVNRTVRDSPCWHDAVTRAEAMIAR